MNFMIQLSAVSLFGIILHGFLAWTAFHLTHSRPTLQNVTWLAETLIQSQGELLAFNGNDLFELASVNFVTNPEEATTLTELIPMELSLETMLLKTSGTPTVLLQETEVIWSPGLGGFLTVKGERDHYHLLAPLTLFAWMNIMILVVYLAEALCATYLEQRYHHLTTTKKVALLFTVRTIKKLLISVFEISLFLFFAGVRSLTHYTIWLAFTFAVELLKLFNPFTSLLFLGRSDEILEPWIEEREGLLKLQKNHNLFQAGLDLLKTFILIALVRGWGLGTPPFWNDLSDFFTLGPGTLVAVSIVLYLLFGQLTSLLFMLFNSIFVQRVFWTSKTIHLEGDEVGTEGLLQRLYGVCFRRENEFFYFFIDSLLQVSLSSGFYYIILASFTDSNFLWG